MLIRNCKNCDKDFDVEERKRVYCSAKCRQEFKRNNPPKEYTKICEVCGKQFKTITNKTKFCSMKCNGFNISSAASKRRAINISLDKKKCSKCGQFKKISDFYNVKGRSGSPSWCKECKLEQNKKYAKNPEVAAKKKEWRAKYNLSTSDLRKISRIRRIYGISHEQYINMFDSQNGECAICKNKLMQEPRGINIDHCHDTGKVRGILCKNCNLGLGFFKDNKESLVRAISYLDNGTFM